MAEQCLRCRPPMCEETHVHIMPNISYIGCWETAEAPSGHAVGHQAKSFPACVQGFADENMAGGARLLRGIGR